MPSSSLDEQPSLPLLSYPPLSTPRSSFSSTRTPSLLHILSRISFPAVLLTTLAFVYFAFYPSSTGSAGKETVDWKEWTRRNGSNVDVFKGLEIKGKDGDSRAIFTALGASLNEFWVRDREGNMRDIVIGYPDPRSAVSSPSTYAYFGSIVGRYANRISQSSFISPYTNESFNLPVNEGDSTTLHGGMWGYSRSGWKVESHKENEIVFSLLDQGSEGFPGIVQTLLTYTLSSSPTRFTTHIISRVLSPLPLRTPILLSSHIYWNLGGWATETDRGKGGGMKLWVDSDRTVEVDEGLIPTGKLMKVEKDGPLDFGGEEERERELGEVLEDPRVKNLCGPGCTGIDNALIYSNLSRTDWQQTVMTLSSASSGIRLKARTNQPLLHLYSCNSPSFSQGAYPKKPSHGEGSYEQYSCLAVEQEGWIDGLHHRDEWELTGEKNQWYDEKREYEWWSEYEFENFD